MRDVNSLRGLHTLRTLHTTRRRSIPRIQGSTYLDLYMLGKEKERLLKENERLDLRNAGIKKRLKEIELEVNKLQEAEDAVKPSTNQGSPPRAFTQRNRVKKEWKKMALSY